MVEFQRGRDYADEQLFQEEATISQEHSSFRKFVIPCGMPIAFKLSPGTNINRDTFAGQSDKDWSGLYAQFSVHHAVSYLTNHYDRGAEDVILYSITTCCEQGITAFIYKDRSFGDVTISSAAKAKKLRAVITLSEGLAVPESEPLLKYCGEQLGFFVVMYDADDLECAIPHCLMDSGKLSFKILAHFRRNPNIAYITDSVSLRAHSRIDEPPESLPTARAAGQPATEPEQAPENGTAAETKTVTCGVNNNYIDSRDGVGDIITFCPLRLGRSIRSDAIELAAALSDLIRPNTFEWIDQLDN